MSENPDTASPQGPDPQGPDGVNAYTPRSDGQGMAPPYPYPDQAAQRVTKPSITQNPMTPRLSEPGPERVTPTSPLQGHPDDPMPWTADAGENEKQTPQEVPAKPRRDVQQTEPARASSRSRQDGAKTAATKPTTKGARSKREVPKTPSAHR